MSIITTLMLISAGCNFNVPEDKIQLAKNEKPKPKMLTFSTKAVSQSMETVFKLPNGSFTKIELNTNTNINDKDKIKIPENGDFRIIFDKVQILI